MGQRFCIPRRNTEYKTVAKALRVFYEEECRKYEDTLEWCISRSNSDERARRWLEVNAPGLLEGCALNKNSFARENYY